MKVLVALTCCLSLIVIIQAPLVLASRPQASRLLLVNGAFGDPCETNTDCSATGAQCPSDTKTCTGPTSNGGFCNTNTDCFSPSASCVNAVCTGKGTVAANSACVAASDCQVPQSSCLSSKCSSPGSIADGDTCITKSDCKNGGATCTQQKCTPPGSVKNGDACTETSDCAAGSTCGVNSKVCLGEGMADSLPTPTPTPRSSSSPTPTPTPRAPAVFKVTFSASLPKLTVATFGDQQKADFKSAVLSKATGATSCTLSGIRDGSLMLNSEVTFPQSGANARTNADSFSNVIKTSPSSVFPADTYGNVTVTDVKSQSSRSRGLGLSFVVFFAALIITGIAQ